ncbi:HTH domain-containing protein [Selenomonas ruminantium]|uniref:HTH domain-containing protein n=1 Tax=Selenomonas ruminantium TaxID=971 RepID=A0A1M6RKY2_SELRU|nr:helix-turn-helix domain containing protein [Selenomonas ruminantium]SHK33028.1 HTH domain-containing protein [Selenomonas ruminantium]
MLPILDKNFQKEYALLSLLDSDERYFPCQELAERLALSERTVYKYLQSLTTQLEGFPPEELSIERSAAFGIRLHRAPWLNIHSIYTQFAQKSLTYDFFHSLFLETTDTTTAFCLTHFVSPASLYRSLSPMRQTLMAFSLNLDAADMRLTGEEMQIRYFYNNFYLQIYRGYGWPFPGIARQLVMNTIDDILGALDAPMSISDRKHFSYWLAISAHRLSLRHCLTEPLPAELGLDNEAYHTALPAIERFFQRLHLPICQAECQFVFYLLHAFPFGMNVQQRLFAAARDARGFDCLPLTATDHFLAVFARHFPQWMGMGSPSFRLKLHRLHFHGALLRGSSDLLERYPFLKSYRQDFPAFAQRMDKLFASLAPHSCGRCFADERYLLPHYILLCSQYFDLAAGEPIIRLALLTDYGPIYEEKIKKEIISRFRDDFHIKFAAPYEGYDILITNLPVKIVTSGHLTLSIHTAFNQREWALLAKLLRQRQELLIPEP